MKSSRKRISRALANAHKEIKRLQAENQEVQRKSWKMQKKVYRMNKHMKTTSTHITSSSDQSDPASPSPRTLADKEIRLSRLTPRQVPKIRRTLLVANCITSELRQAGKANSKQLGGLRNVIAGKIVKKYRVTKAFSIATGLNRRKMSLSCTKLITNFSRKRKNTLRSTMSGHIIEFLERDDNSRMMPEKRTSRLVQEKEVPGKEKKRKEF